MIVIGITGTLGAGKGTVVAHLETKGFRHYSARAFIVREIESRGLPVNRDSMTVVADDLRAIHSPSYIIESLYGEAERSGGDAVIESIRGVGEVEAMKKKDGFYLFAIDADPKIRYERIRLRASSTDAVSFEKFLADEDREFHSPESHRQNISRCMELADYKLTNNGTVEELNAQVEAILREIGQASQPKSSSSSSL
jgi:dephospho-CoA kinase